MKIIKFLHARLVTWKYKLHWEEMKYTKWPKIWWCKVLNKYIVFCSECGEYVCNDGICSNPFCPEKIEN